MSQVGSHGRLAHCTSTVATIISFRRISSLVHTQPQYLERNVMLEFSYSAWHKRLSHKLGAAKTKQCVSCGWRASDWALKEEHAQGTYGKRVHVESFDAYEPLCRSCHKRRDTVDFGFKHTPETKKQLSAMKTGMRASPEARAKMSASQKGKKHSADTKRKISETQSKRYTPEIRAKKSETARKLKVRCPHCSKIGHPAPMGRYHFDRCRDRNDT